MEFKTQDTNENYEEKTLCVFVLDCSGSMIRADRIGKMEAGLREFMKEIGDDTATSQCLEIAVITYSAEFQLVVQPTLVERANLPKLVADGPTLMIPAIDEAIRVVEERKKYYRGMVPYRRPFIILLTDGEPYPEGQDFAGVKSRIQEGESGAHFTFWAIGVGEANMAFLTGLSVRPPRKLEGTKFMQFFEWLGNSMKIVSQAPSGSKAKIPSPDDWIEC